MLNEIEIGNHRIGLDRPPFIIAEMSGNHNRSLERALKIVEAAAKCGCHALKLQTYTAETMTIRGTSGAFFIDNAESLWKGQDLHSLYLKANTPWEWHEPIFSHCRELGLIAFSTPFDETSVDFLEKLGTPAYKIASFENAHMPLIKKVASTGKPLIISTGMSTIAELDETVRTAKNVGCKEIILLKCTSTYPATPDETNLRTIPHLRELFGTQVGLSDHTLGVGVSIAAVALGASVIEKHFTLSRADGGVDAAFSIEPDEMQLLVQETTKAWQALGKVHYGPTESEKKSIIFRRSVYVVKDVREGDLFTPENLRVIRPGDGLKPKYYEILLGKKASCNIQKATPMRWDFIT